MNSHYWRYLPALGSGETRRCRGLYQLTEMDVLEGRHFDDAIAYGSYRVDVHYPEGGGYLFKYLDGSTTANTSSGKVFGRWREERDHNPTFYQIPFRSMITKQCDNLIMAGRMIDADTAAFGAIRVMVNMNQTGEAAGEAAALMIQHNYGVEQVAAAQLRARMQDGGSFIFEQAQPTLT